MRNRCLSMCHSKWMAWWFKHVSIGESLMPQWGSRTLQDCCHWLVLSNDHLALDGCSIMNLHALVCASGRAIIVPYHCFKSLTMLQCPILLCARHSSHLPCSFPSHWLFSGPPLGHLSSTCECDMWFRNWYWLHPLTCVPLQATAGSLQSLCWASAAAGGIISSYSSGYLIDKFGPRYVFGIIAIFPIIITCSSLLVSEQRVTGQTRLEENGAGMVMHI